MSPSPSRVTSRAAEAGAAGQGAACTQSRAPLQSQAAAWDCFSPQQCRKPWKSVNSIHFSMSLTLIPSVLPLPVGDQGRPGFYMEYYNLLAAKSQTEISKSFPILHQVKPRHPQALKPKTKTTTHPGDAALWKVSGQPNPQGKFLSAAQVSPWRGLSHRINLWSWLGQYPVWNEGENGLIISG